MTTPEFIVCECGKYAYVVRADVLCKLPKNYMGELCEKCTMWMCSVDVLRNAGYDIPAQKSDREKKSTIK